MQSIENTPQHFFSKFITWLNNLGSLLILGLVLIINLDVSLRFFFNSPIDGVTELVELSIVAIVFLQLADAIRHGRLTRSDGVFNQLQKRWPVIGQGFGLLFDICGAVFFIIILSGTFPRLIEAWSEGYYVGNQGIFIIPLWPIRLIVIIGALTVVIVFLNMAWKHWTALCQIYKTGSKFGNTTITDEEKR